MIDVIPTIICTKCGKELPATTEFFYRKKHGKYGLCSMCKGCVCEYNKRRLANDGGKHKLYTQQYREDHKEYFKQYRLDHAEEISKYMQDYHQRDKLAVILHYGGCCAMCGITDIAKLCIDHIDNNGVEDRKLGIRGHHLYHHLIKNNFPGGFQVLCWNHNWKKHIELCHLNRKPHSTNARNLKSHDKLKREVIDHYGKVCEICGEDDIDVLSIDHILGGGNQQLRELGIEGGVSFYRMLRDSGYPTEFRVLCFNDNCAKHIE